MSFRKETGEKKNSKVTRKTITADRRKSMFSGNCKTVNSSVVIKVAIMNTSKGSLEPRGFKLPVKVGKDMTADEVRVLAQKNIQITISFFRSQKTTYSFILIPNLCAINLVQMSHLQLRNIKKSLANHIQK